jgi:hypothetical protein
MDLRNCYLYAANTKDHSAGELFLTGVGAARVGDSILPQ